jgi:hypothetical protein
MRCLVAVAEVVVAAAKMVATDVTCWCSNLTRGREERKDTHIPMSEREEETCTRGRGK